MAESGDAREDDDSSSLILDLNLMASLTEPVRKSINRKPRMANVRKLARRNSHTHGRTKLQRLRMIQLQQRNYLIARPL
jgi:hypothetical protein